MTVPPDGRDDIEPVELPTRAARGVSIRRPRGGGHVVRDQGGPAARPWEATGAIDVERLAVWAYRDQKVDRSATAGLYALEAAAGGHFVSGYSSDGCAQLARIAHMGCRVDTFGVVIRDVVHPAAEALASALAGIEGGEMVAKLARLNGRPEGWAMPDRWYRAAEWKEPWVDAVVERSGPGGRIRWCAVVPTTTLGEVVKRRTEYVTWWDALDELAWRLSMRALGFVVLPPSAPRMPWQGAVA